jgi:hypothetical protein
MSCTVERGIVCDIDILRPDIPLLCAVIIDKRKSLLSDLPRTILHENYKTTNINTYSLYVVHLCNIGQVLTKIITLKIH